MIPSLPCRGGTRNSHLILRPFLLSDAFQSSTRLSWQCVFYFHDESDR